MFSPGRDRATRAGFGKPQALDVFLGKGHRRVKADDGKVLRDMQDDLDDGFAHLSLRIIELGGVIPRKRSAVVAVIDIACIASRAVIAFEDNRRIGMIVVMIFQNNLDAIIIRQAFAIKGICGIWRLRSGQEPIRMFDDPA